MRSLAERMAAGKPEPFIFKDEGDFIQGVIEDIYEQSGDYGSYKVTTILTEDGSAHNVAWFGGVLKGQFDSKRPQVGMTIAIRYEGTKPSKVKGHQPYKDFWVLLDEATRPAGAPAPVPSAPAFAPGDAAEDFGEEPF